jgi:hypothetical protein
VFEAALAAKDYPAQVFMHWFINEQVEEEAWCAEMIDGLPRQPVPAPGGARPPYREVPYRRRVDVWAACAWAVRSGGGPQSVWGASETPARANTAAACVAVRWLKTAAHARRARKNLWFAAYDARALKSASRRSMGSHAGTNRRTSEIRRITTLRLSVRALQRSIGVPVARRGRVQANLIKVSLQSAAVARGGRR